MIINRTRGSIGIEAGLVWGSLAEATVVYEDHGISRGMQFGIEKAGKEGRPVERRKIYPETAAT